MMMRKRSVVIAKKRGCDGMFVEKVFGIVFAIALLIAVIPLVVFSFLSTKIIGEEKVFEGLDYLFPEYAS